MTPFKTFPLFSALAVLLVAFATPVFAKIERVVEKTFTVRPDARVTIATFGGDIRVVAGEGSEVKIVATQRFRRADSEAQADEIAKNLTLEIAQEGDEVVAKARYDAAGWNWRGSPVSVAFVVTVPARTRLELNTSGGDIVVPNVAGAVNARTSGGDIRLGAIDGAVKAATSGGDVSLESCTGDVALSTSGGDVRAGQVGGRARLDTSGGDIVVSGVGGSVEASTSGGNIDVAIDGALLAECRLGTSGGNVKISVPKAAAFQLDARTSGGRVTAPGLTLAVESGALGKTSVRGRVNAGGALLRARTSGGDIVVKAL